MKSGFKIYNSYSREKEYFEPVSPPHVGMYVCGPTVYGDPHLGHARAAITFDVLFRYLQYLQYKVRYVSNITDVGHLEDELAGAGEDKVAKKARLEQLEPMEIVQYYLNRYHDALRELNVLPPSIEPHASGHIIEQIEMIREIMKSGYAYEVNGSVYFDVVKYSASHDYGKLSGKVLEELEESGRELEGQAEKRNRADFALWKKASPEHIMRWPSPWSEGFPGWHLECSAMSAKYLGEQFDIHGGGMDLKFQHHECEIAQAKASKKGKDPVKYWVHNNLITIEGQKMSKSLNNFITVQQLFSGDHPKLEQAYSPMALRFFILQTHYRSTLDFSNEALQAAEKGYKRLMNALHSLDTLEHKNGQLSEKEDAEINGLLNACHEHMNDDLNTARALASLFDLSNKINAFKNKQLSLEIVSGNTLERLKNEFPLFIYEILGLREESAANNAKLDEVLQVLIEIRKDAREKKDFATSDKIRDELEKAGITLKDSKEGTTWSIE